MGVGASRRRRYRKNRLPAPSRNGGKSMQRRLWLLVGAAAALVVVAGAATARSKVVGHRATASGATMAAAPFAEAWAKVPPTAAGRRAANVVVVGAEQTFNGFNTNLNCCNQLWATFAGGEEAGGHGAFIQNQKGQWVKDLVSSASASKTGVTYTIRPDAVWYWGGKKLPVTYKDFVYTMQQIDNPNNDLQSRTGYSNLNPTKFKHKGDNEN